MPFVHTAWVLPVLDRRIEAGVESLQLATKLGLEEGESKDFPATIGKYGQVQVIPTGSRLSELLLRLKSLEEASRGDLDENTATEDAVRWAASTFLLHFTRYKGRRGLRISFPEEIEKLGFLEFQNSLIVMVAAGHLVEFWAPKEWKEFISGTMRDRPALVTALTHLTRILDARIED